MNVFMQNLKHQAEENPMLAIGVAGAVVSVITKFLGASVDLKNSHAWSREVARRAMKDATRM